MSNETANETPRRPVEASRPAVTDPQREFARQVARALALLWRAEAEERRTKPSATPVDGAIPGK